MPKPRSRPVSAASFAAAPATASLWGELMDRWLDGDDI